MSTFDWGGLLGGLLQGGISAYGFKELMDEVDKSQTSIMGPGGVLDTARGDINDNAGFTGYGIKSAVGQAGYDAATNEMDYTLDPAQQAQANMLRNNATSMYGQSMSMDPRFGGRFDSSNAAYNTFMGRSMQDTAGREADVYNRIREMQRPEETRQYESMNAGLFGSGRGGMQTDAYGGTPEEMAFGKARAEAMNTASVQAMQQAQAEQMQQGNLANMYGQMGMGALGQGAQYQAMQNQMAGMMQQNQYLPLQQLMALNQQGQASSGMQNQSGQALAGLLAQLGIGEGTIGVNYQNVKGNALVGLLEALGTAASGAGQAIGDAIP